jgi:hypothetical protein
MFVWRATAATATTPSTASAMDHLMTRSAQSLGTADYKDPGQGDIASMRNW